MCWRWIWHSPVPARPARMSSARFSTSAMRPGSALSSREPALGRLFTRGQSPALVARAVRAALERDALFERVPVGEDAARELGALDAGSRADYLDRLRRLYGLDGSG